LKICQKCKTENIFNGAQFCRNCGASLESSIETKSSADNNLQDDKLEFVVTETSSTSAPDFIGTEDKGNSKIDNAEKLEIKANANLLDDDEPDLPSVSEQSRLNPIGEIVPLVPMPIEETSMESPAISKNNSLEEQQKSDFKKLSKEEVANITKNLYGSEDNRAKGAKRVEIDDSGKARAEMRSASAEPASARHSAIPSPTAEVRPIDDPAQQANFQKSHKVRGVAFFRGNFVQLIGNPYLHEGDEITVNERHYLLRSKRLSRKTLIISLASVFVAILFIIGSQFISPTVSGDGEIIGMILDQNRQPLLESARISIPALNKTTKTNAQGFFRFEMVPTGAYELAFQTDNQYSGRGNITVTPGQTTLMTFGSNDAQTGTSATRNIAINTPQNQIVSLRESQIVDSKNANPDSKPTAGLGNLKLAANVENARVSLDGKVLGAGNNTYGRIKPGMHTVKIDKDGYSEYMTTIDIKSNETFELNLNLTKFNSNATTANTLEDYLRQGDAAVNAKEYSKAIDAFNNALALSPSSKDAYSKRAETYGQMKENDKAADDYIRLGELHRASQNNEKAITVFSSALAYAPQNKIALASRGNARLDNGDYRPALIDFEAALKIDNQFYPALLGGGVAQFKLGNNKQADKYFKNANKINQDDPYLYQNMMLNYLALDDIKNIKKVYAEFKTIANPSELAELKSSNRFQPVLRLIEEKEQ
jgi:tetratricopeptide (TPR) repeat protein